MTSFLFFEIFCDRAVTESSTTNVNSRIFFIFNAVWIDYLVFTDASQYIQQGKSPYDRHTYRYTPFLAGMLSKFSNKEIGRYIFCIADTICGYIILQMRQVSRKKQQQDEGVATNNDHQKTNYVLEIQTLNVLDFIDTRFNSLSLISIWSKDQFTSTFIRFIFKYHLHFLQKWRFF